MSALDWIVLLGTILGIASYGWWRTRHTDHLDTYLKGSRTTGWFTIGLSVAATQASTITYLSLPGQAYENGMAFLQNYLGLPLALILVCAVFVPIYRRLGVYTAYEYLGQRFDRKTRLLGAGLFLLQRGLQSGITIYAPSIILATVLGWRIDVIIIGIGLVAILYTVTGGSAAVNLTQKWQMAVIWGGMLTAFGLLLWQLPDHALPVAGVMGKLQAVNFDPDPKVRYTVWSGLLGGFFLSLSYFGTDQSQVQRYLAGASVRESRLGLVFNALLKIPMQFFIVLLGALLFVFYQFQPDTPLVFNRAAWQQQLAGPRAAEFRALDEKHTALHAEKHDRIVAWVAARDAGDPAAEAAAREALTGTQRASDALRKDARAALQDAAPETRRTKDSDFVFISFVLHHLPHGVIGLLLAVMFASALSSKAGELNALGTTTTIDLWRSLRPQLVHDERRNVTVAKRFTALWGAVAIAFALSLGFAEDLIESLNIVASIFYPTLLGLFVVAFFLKRVGGTAAFWAAIAAQAVVLAIYFIGKAWPAYEIGYLWLNPIGCAAVGLFALILQAGLPPKEVTGTK